MLPVKLKLVSIKNILSRWLHIGCLASHIIFTCWPTQRVGLSHSLLFFTGQLNVLAYLIFFTGQLNVLACHDFFLPANSTCWPVIIFFTGQLNMLAFLGTVDLIGSCYSLSHMLGKYFLRCWPLTATGNLTPSNSSSMYAFLGKT